VSEEENVLFRNVTIESIAYVLPPHRVTSAYLEDQLAEPMQRLGIRQGRLEQLSGIKERRWWDEGVRPSDLATAAARMAIEQAGIDPQEIGCLINTSVSLDYLEPSTAVFVHGNLGLAQTCINYDVRNACLGFLNGMANIGMLIDAGAIRYGIVVNGETSRETVQTTIERLHRPGTTLQDFFENFATLTLGSGSVAMVLGHADASRTGHRLEGAVTMAATEHNQLCVGNIDGMKTDAPALLVAGVRLMGQTWQQAQEEFADWSDECIAAYAPHQVSARHTAAVIETLGITPSKVQLNFPWLGNIGPAALPISLAQAAESGKLSSGDRVALMGIGSGLNCSIMSVIW
jgi:3-oxoacyl-[acyl-carrier-protein] synthase III